MDAAENWQKAWAEITARAEETKDSMSAIPALLNAYDALGEDERTVVNAVLAEAAESGNETERFDALALIREFTITEAVPSLKRLATRLEISDDVGAPFELEKVNTILGHLETR
jgi:hypothetical protein